MSWHEKYLSKNQKKKTVSTQDDLFSLFEEVLKETPITEMSDKARRKEAEKFLLTLPKFTPTEAWGDPQSTGRKTINRIFSVVGGGASVEGKLAYLQRITDVNNRITSPRRVISSLIILEALAAIISDFNEASAGFVFEGWLAALLQGRQEAERTEKGNLPIQDLVAFTQLKDSSTRVPVSLKLLSPKTMVEGSYTNLIDALFDEPEFGGRMNYVVARKLENHIAIQSFDLNQENFIDIITLQKGAKGTTKLKASGAALFTISDRELARKYNINGSPEQVIALLNNLTDPNEKYEVLMRTAGYSKANLKRRLAAQAEPAEQPEVEASEEELQERAVKRYSKAERTLLESTQTQWALSVSQLDTLVSAGKIQITDLGELPKTKEMVVEIAMMHMDTVREKFQILFKAFSDLSENINKYITFPKRADAMRAGERAITDTGVIQQEIQESVQSDESATEEDLD